MPAHATGIAQSGGLKPGFRSDEYHAIVLGWLGEGLLDALKASGTAKAQAAMAAAAGADRVGGFRFWSCAAVSIVLKNRPLCLPPQWHPP